MGNWLAKIHTNDPNQSFIIRVFPDEPTEDSVKKEARKWMAEVHPDLTIKDLVVDES